MTLQSKLPGASHAFAIKAKPGRSETNDRCGKRILRLKLGSLQNHLTLRMILRHRGGVCPACYFCTKHRRFWPQTYMGFPATISGKPTYLSGVGPPTSPTCWLLPFLCSSGEEKVWSRHTTCVLGKPSKKKKVLRQPRHIKSLVLHRRTSLGLYFTTPYGYVKAVTCVVLLELCLGLRERLGARS